MSLKYFTVLIMSLLISFACANEDKETYPSKDADPGSPDYVRIQGHATNGPCREGGRITGIPVDETFTQQVGHFISELQNHLGFYDLPAEIPTRRAEVFGTFDCYSETSNDITYDKEMKAIVDLSANEANSITPMTTISANVSRHLMSNSFGAADECIIEAERLILEYAGLPNYNVRFTNIKLNEGLGSDVLLAFNSAITLNRDASLQSQLMANITEDIKAGTTAYRQSFRSSLRDLPIMHVKSNIESIYASLGTQITSPAFWNIIDSDGDGIPNASDPDSSIEILNRTPVLKYVSNLSLSTQQINAGVSSLKYANPKVFTEAVLTSNYYGTSLDGDVMEIYTVKTSNSCNLNGGGYPVGNVITCLLPDQLVFTATKLKENYFGTSLKNEANETVSGLPETSVWNITGHNLSAGTQYYVVMSKSTPYSMSKYSSTVDLPFGKMLMYDEGCAVATDICTENWFGYNNTTTMFTKDGEKSWLAD